MVSFGEGTPKVLRHEILSQGRGYKMNVDKLVRLFAAQGGSLRATSENSAERSGAAPKVAADAAVKVAGDFGTASGEAEQSARRERVEALKQSVASGSYKPDSEKVAQAVYRELFA